MSDEITLTIPRERPFYGVAHLVLGGLGLRLNLTYENLEDLQLALDGLLDRDEGGREITLSFSVRENSIEVRLGPFDGEALGAELERDPGEEMSLRRLLDTVVDRYRVGRERGLGRVQ